MDARKLKQEFRAIALKRKGYEFRNEALFTLKEIINVIEFFEDFNQKKRAVSLEKQS